MSQLKKQSQPKSNVEIQRRPKRCLVCKKMFAFDKFNDHLGTCSKEEQKKIEESRQKLRDTRQTFQNKSTFQSVIKVQNKQKPLKDNPEEPNKFRIKNINSFTSKLDQGKSKSVVVKNNRVSEIKKEQIKVQTINKPKQQIKQAPIQPQIKKEELLPNNSVESIHIQQQRQEIPVRNQQRSQIARPSPRIIRPQPQRQPIRVRHEPINRMRGEQQPRAPTLIEPEPEHSHRQQQPMLYDIQALISNSNSIIEFIRNINILGQDETMNSMLAQLEQLNMIAHQIVQLNQIGHVFGTTMGNVFASRIHELQTVITNQIGVALIRGFNERLGSQFQNLMYLIENRRQRAPQIKDCFTEEQIDETFPQKINYHKKECSICLQDMNSYQMIIELQCYHLFHPGCIKEWLISSLKCPMCRKVQKKVK